MRLSDIVRHITNLFEKKRKNPIQLETDSNLESNLKFLKVSDKSTPIQISEDKVNVEGNLTVNGSDVITEASDVDSLNDLSDVSYSSGDLEITSLDKIVASTVAIEKSGDPAPFVEVIGGAGDERTQLTLYEAGGASDDDYINFDVRANGSTVISTVDAAGANADLEINADGDFKVSSTGGIKIKEVSDAIGDTAAYGQIWIKNSTPNELYFTTDAGDDIQLTSGTGVAGGGGTDTWNFTIGGYKTNNNSATNYYAQYYPNFYGWTRSDSSPTSISYVTTNSTSFTADKDGALTNIRITMRAGDTGATDPLQYYVYKGTCGNNSSSTSCTLIGTSGTITHVLNRTMVLSTDFSSSNTFSEGDSLFVWLKKDSTSGNQDIYMSVTVSGTYD